MSHEKTDAAADRRRYPTLALAALLAGLELAAMPARGGIIADRPDTIICSVSDPTGVLPWNELVFYVSAHTRGGATLYKTLTSDPVVLTVGPDGRVAGANLADCDGRTLTALRAAGRALDLARPPAAAGKP